ncbi:glycerophosphodiester phosphodiesterase family protein [Hymenobacter elongatus]|uniref:Glycerophosphodiester phosphodiesterase n=1 Tax=Hymenobacter elongatus TaxID=877208 RepID=A0A4Z0PIX6_9BACT|nr:glycerophosphodiester phosphodiesterase family protein [Hymenobacter elongatus]TGE14888.1 glycerophosphodiester phosphodiesterase [Hymenobacter elongatus]
MNGPFSSPVSSFPRPEIHGHRGCRGLFPENTLPAFQHALALGVDALELDVVVSADGQVVVSHEPWFSAAICRLPDGQRIDPAREREHNLYRLPYNQIREYDCGLTPHPRFPRQHSLPAYKPLLRDVIRSAEEQVLRSSRPPIHYSIEVKTEPAGDGVFHPAPEVYVALVLALIEQEGIADRVTLLSFAPRILQNARVQAPHIPVCLLVEDRLPLAEHLARLGFTPHVYGPDYRLLTPDLLRQARRLGMRIVPWTVNDIAAMHDLIRYGVDGITTDYPDVLQALLLQE